MKAGWLIWLGLANQEDKLNQREQTQKLVEQIKASDNEELVLAADPFSANSCNSDEDPIARERSRNKIFGAVLIAGCAGIAYIGGFTYALGAVQKQAGGDKSETPVRERERSLDGVRLARRALGWGTLYAVGGVTLFTVAVAALANVTSPTQLREKVQQKFQPIIGVKKGDGRSDFASFRELFDYLEHSDQPSSSKTQSKNEDTVSNQQ